MALKKPSKQSTTEKVYGMPNNAMYANDGDLTTRSYTKKARISWWTVDMEKFVRIFRIEIYLLPHSFKNNHYGELSISTRVQESHSWDLCVKLGVPKSLNNTIICDSKTTARYLKVSSEKRLVLREVEIYGI